MNNMLLLRISLFQIKISIKTVQPQHIKTLRKNIFYRAIITLIHNSLFAFSWYYDWRSDSSSPIWYAECRVLSVTMDAQKYIQLLSSFELESEPAPTEVGNIFFTDDEPLVLAFFQYMFKCLIYYIHCFQIPLLQ